MNDFKFSLGDLVKDQITGFEGVVTNRTQWLNNCNVYGVQPRELKDGKQQEKGHFDEPQLDLVESKVVGGSRLTGGPAKSTPMTNR